MADVVEYGSIQRPTNNVEEEGARQSPRCFVLETVILLFFVAHGIAIPVNIFYAKNQLHGKHEETDCNAGNQSDIRPAGTDTEKSELATYFMYNKLTNVLGIIPAVYFGSVTDRVGRKIGMIIPTLGILLKGIVFYVFISMNSSIYFLLIGCALEDITGGFAVILLSCYGSIADVTTPGSPRAFRFAVIDSLQAITNSLAIITTGFWINSGDFRNPMILSTTTSVALMIIILTVVPETLPRTSAVECDFRLFFRCVSVYRNSVYFSGRQWKMLVSLLCFILTVSVNFSKSKLQEIVLIYPPFCWSAIKVTLYVSLGLISCWCIILIVTKILQKCFHCEDLTLGIIGCVSSTASLIIFGLSNTDAALIAAEAVGALLRLVIPMIRAFTSRHVLIKEQGSLYASFAVMEVMIGGIAGATYDYIFGKYAYLDKGFLFFVMAGFMTITLSLMILLKVKTKSEIDSGYVRISEDDSPFER